MIRIGIVGYGNLGKSVEKAIKNSPDMDLIKIFSRRNLDHKSYESLDNILAYKDEIDLLILCGSSDKDIMSQGPKLLENFNTLDSFDNHAKIKEYYQMMDEIGKKSDRLALISTGWDPGLFSLQRLIGQAILPQGATYTFWGKGVSQGHSAAVRAIKGVIDATQYTIPKDEVLEKVRAGEEIEFDPHKAHLREVFVVAEEDADKGKIEEAIKTMPDYFVGYETIVHFISQEELNRDHKEMVHGGYVFRNGLASGSTRSVMEFSLDLNSNPDFTAACDISYARAAYALKKEGKKGAITVLDVAPKYLSFKSYEDLIDSI